MTFNTMIVCMVLSISFVYGQLPKPSDSFGFEVGTDYKLAGYPQMLAYYAKLDAATPRVRVSTIGHSVDGKPIKLIIVSSAKNMRSLEKWRSIAEKMARARISHGEAIKLSREGRAIVWFDGGMHATEAAHAQMTSELIYRIASDESEEMQKIRDRVITLIVPVINPDGLEIVRNWYNKHVGSPYETSNPPILYQRYVGHDNNRDWFMNNMPETRAATAVLYNQWYPQIVHNHHQPAPSWARIFVPPFRSPVNNRIHPGVTTGVNLVGMAMANRFAMKKMPGVISTTRYEMWWNGGMRTTPYYHNQIGILTETAHMSPTPSFYPLDSIPERINNKAHDGTEIFYPYPWKGGESHFRDAVNYMITASIAVLDLAADKKDEFLFNIYQMGRDAIEDKAGSYAYIVPTKQRDRQEAINLINIMLQGGVEVQQATHDFTADDSLYRAGSYIMYGGQAFRPYLADLMEPQTYPNLYQYEGGPPKAPYDLTGWTLPMQMGVRVVRANTPFKATTQPITSPVKVDPGHIDNTTPYGFVLPNTENISALAINRLLKAGEHIFITTSPIVNNKSTYGAGSFFIAKGAKTRERIKRLCAETGLSFFGLQSRPPATMRVLHPIKIGIYKSWIPNPDEGWTRWMLTQFGFDVDTLHNVDIQKKDLSLYSTIIFPSQTPSQIMHGHLKGSMPENFTGGIGLQGALALERYVKKGGVLMMFGDACDLAIDQFGLPISNLTKNLSRDEFFIPGSLVRIQMNRKSPLTYGMPAESAANFSKSDAFSIKEPSPRTEGGKRNLSPAPTPDVNMVATYANKDILMSGWGLGQDTYIKGKAAMINAGHGKGRVILFGFRPQFRGQTRATYKLIFNTLYLGASK